MNILKKNLFYYIIGIICILYSLILTNLYEFKSKYNGHETNFNAIVEKIDINGDKLTLQLNSRERIVGNYYFKSENEKNYIISKLNLGNKITISGNLIKPKNNTVPNGFNYKKYLYRNKIYWILNINNFKNINKSNNLFYKFKNCIISKIDKYKYSKNYLYAFILGNTSKIDNKIVESYRNNGISHLFAVSGMHVSLIIGVILFILRKTHINSLISNVICYGFLFFYMFLTNFSPSIIRASLFFIMLSLNKILKLNIKTINLLILVLCIILIINPFLIYNTGFQYSYSISFGLILFSNTLKNTNNYILKLLKVSLIAFLIGLPISIYNFYQINILSIFLNIIFVPLISFIIFPFSLLIFLIPHLDYINYLFINILEFLSLNISKIDILNIIVSKPNIIGVLIYYFVIILILYKMKQKKYWYTLMIGILLLIHSNYSYLNNKTYITMIDVGQGDSILIVLPHNKKNIMIDTGGIVNYNYEEWKVRKNNYSIALDTTIPMLKSLGIKRIDYLILTHGDYDHMGESINLVNNFKVGKVIFNCGPYNDLENELIKVLDKKKINYYSCIKELNIDNNKLYFLNPKEYNNENDNSNVIYTEISGYKFLFMGDASTFTEKEILNKYNLPNIDVLKVGHHGSKTSSSEEFIDTINPKYSLISVGKNNRYGHPSGNVLNALENSKIYRTDLDGSIMFKIKSNKLEIATCSP